MGFIIVTYYHCPSLHCLIFLQNSYYIAPKPICWYQYHSVRTQNNLHKLSVKYLQGKGVTSYQIAKHYADCNHTCFVTVILSVIVSVIASVILCPTRPLAVMFPDMQTCKRLSSVIKPRVNCLSICLNYNQPSHSLYSHQQLDGGGAHLKRQQFAATDFYSGPILLRICRLDSAGCSLVVFSQTIVS